jgi:hypothetical protein
LQSIRTQQFDYSFLQHESQEGSLETESLASHKLISFAQWTQIVHRRVRQYLNDMKLSPPPAAFEHGNAYSEKRLYDDASEGDPYEEEGEHVHDEEEWVMSAPPSSLHRAGGQLHPRPASQKHPSRAAQTSMRDAAEARSEALYKVIVL